MAVSPITAVVESALLGSMLLEGAGHGAHAGRRPGGSISSEQVSRPSAWRGALCQMEEPFTQRCWTQGEPDAGGIHPDRVPRSMCVLRTFHCILKAKGEPRWIQRSGANG